MRRALLYDEPRYAWTYKHLGVINLIAESFIPLTAGGLSPAAHNFGTGHGGRH